MRAWIVLFSGLVAVTPPAGAASVRSISGENASARRRLSVNSLLTDRGTLEIEWGNTFAASGNYSMPSLVKFTPAGEGWLEGKTEYSVGFDSVSSQVSGSERDTQFGDRISLFAHTKIIDGDHFDIAIAPQASFLLRGDTGARLGGAVFGRFDGKDSINSGGWNVSWTGATASSPTNPAGTLDVGFGYGRKLGPSGSRLNQWTIHAESQIEKSTGVTRIFSLFQGVEYQVTKRFAVDTSIQEIDLGGANRDTQFVVALTVNMGKLKK